MGTKEDYIYYRDVVGRNKIEYVKVKNLGIREYSYGDGSTGYSYLIELPNKKIIEADKDELFFKIVLD